MECSKWGDSQRRATRERTGRLDGLCFNVQFCVTMCPGTAWHLRWATLVCVLQCMHACIQNRLCIGSCVPCQLLTSACSALLYDYFSNRACIVGALVLCMVQCICTHWHKSCVVRALCFEVQGCSDLGSLIEAVYVYRGVLRWGYILAYISTTQNIPYFLSCVYN